MSEMIRICQPEVNQLSTASIKTLFFWRSGDLSLRIDRRENSGCDRIHWIDYYRYIIINFFVEINYLLITFLINFWQFLLDFSKKVNFFVKNFSVMSYGFSGLIFQFFGEMCI